MECWTQIKHSKAEADAVATTATGTHTKKIQFDSVFKSHVMGPRCMMPSCLRKLLLRWPKLCTHHMHHDNSVHVLYVFQVPLHLCSILPYYTFRWNALPIFSQKKEKKNRTPINSQSEGERFCIPKNSERWLVTGPLFHTIFLPQCTNELFRFIVRA